MFSSAQKSHVSAKLQNAVFFVFNFKLVEVQFNPHWLKLKLFAMDFKLYGLKLLLNFVNF